MTQANGNITLHLARAAQRSPDAAALVVGQRRMSFAELDSLAWAAARHLADAGVVAGDVLGLRLGSQSDLAIALLGAMRLGATPMTLSPSLTDVQRTELLRGAGARYQVVPVPQAAQGDLPHILFDGAGLPRGKEDAALLDEVPAHFCQIIAGSGTTGKPMLIPLTHGNMKARQDALQHNFGLQPGHRFMLVSPLFFASPFRRFLGTIASGGTGVVWDQRTDLLPAVAETRPDFIHLTVLHAHQMLRQAAAYPDLDLSGLGLVSIGASPVSESLRADLRGRLKANLCVEYGANEVGTLTFAFPEDLPKVPDTVGRPPPSVALQIVDETHQPLGADQIGQVRVKSPGRIDGYVGGAKAERFRDGWFYPGDLGKWSEDGQLVHCGRADQLMILDGINIFPSEIEFVLGQHPAVAEVAAFPMPHEVHHEIPVCAVTLKDGATATSQELLAFGRDRLGVRRPRKVVIVDSLPRTERGKLIRAELVRIVDEDERRLSQKVRSEKTPLYPLALRDHPRQIRRALALSFKRPDTIAGAALAAWEPYLRDDVLPCAAADALPSPSGAGSDLEIWLGHVALVTRVLLLRSNIPCFDPILLTACSPRADDPKVCDATFEMPLFESFRPNTVRNAFDEAVSCIRYLNDHAPDARNREEIWSRMTGQSVPRIAQDNRVNSSTLHVLHAAYRQQVPFSHLGRGVYQLGWGAAARIISASTTTADSALGTKLAGHKEVTASNLRRAGLPAPTHVLVRTVEAARTAANRIGWPVVVKPANLERGEGVHVDVGPDQLDQAVEACLKASTDQEALVEAQVKGVCHRLFIAQGKLLYAVKRLPIGVYGDGRHSVAQLVKAMIDAERTIPPWHRSKIRPPDDLARTTLAAQGLTEQSVPEPGRFVALRRIESTAWGGVDEDVTDLVHPENLRVALAATRLSGLNVSGVDIITDDISRPWTETGAIINEVNYSPLLGGGAISRRNLPTYLDRVLGGNGRIPVEVFVGDDAALHAARAHVRALQADGVAAVLTGDRQTWDGSGNPIPLAVTGLAARVRALVFSSEVQALAILVQTDALLNGPLPLEGVDTVHVRGEPRIAGNDPLRRQRLLDVMSAWRWQPNRAAQTVRAGQLTDG